MNRLVVFVFGAICGTGVTAAVHHAHLVQTEDRWLLVPRAAVNLKDVYVDVRKWTAEDWLKHRELSRDMEKAGYAEFVRPETADAEAGEDKPVDRLSQSIDDFRPARHASDELKSDSDGDQSDRPARSARRIDDFDAASFPE